MLRRASGQSPVIMPHVRDATVDTAALHCGRRDEFVGPIARSISPLASVTARALSEARRRRYCQSWLEESQPQTQGAIQYSDCMGQLCDTLPLDCTICISAVICLAVYGKGSSNEGTMGTKADVRQA